MPRFIITDDQDIIRAVSATRRIEADDQNVFDLDDAPFSGDVIPTELDLMIGGTFTTDRIYTAPDWSGLPSGYQEPS